MVAHEAQVKAIIFTSGKIKSKGFYGREIRGGKELCQHLTRGGSGMLCILRLA